MAFGFSNDFSKSIQKKIDKELTILWPSSHIDFNSRSISDSLLRRSHEIGIERIYTLSNAETEVGYMVYVKVPSKFDNFDIAIFYDLDLQIKSMKILAYREDHGGEVGSKRWLKQFIGLGIEDPIKLNDDIQGIAGATISCVSATNGARNVTRFMNRLILIK